jgi:hypothetical protein
MKEATKESVMFKLIEKWQKSELSQKQFSIENNLNVHTMSYWVQRYNKSKISKTGFAALTFAPEPEPANYSPKIEIELAGGIIVRIY